MNKVQIIYKDIRDGALVRSYPILEDEISSFLMKLMIKGMVFLEIRDFHPTNS